MARISEQDREQYAKILENPKFKEVANDVFHVGTEVFFNAKIKKDADAETFLRLVELTYNAAEYSEEHYDKTTRTGDLQEDFAREYNNLQNPFMREKVKTAADNSEELRKAGITRRALDAIDRTGSATRYRDAIKADAAQLLDAAQKNAPAEQIAQILARLNSSQDRDNINTFTAQLDAGREELEDAIKARPDYTETAWQLWGEDNSNGLDTRYYKPRKISFAAGAVSIVAAPTNHGKTTFLMDCALQLAQANTNTNKEKKTYLYISTEEDLQQMYVRALAAYIGDAWPEKDYFEKDVQPRAEIRHFIKNPEDLPLKLCDGSTIGDKTRDYWNNVAPYLRFSYYNGADIDALKYCVTGAVQKAKEDGEAIGGVFVDYLQMIHKAGRNFSRTEELKDVCDGLNDLAKQIGVPLVLAAQLNRSATNSGDYIDAVDVTNMGESAGIERIAHDIYLLWQTNKITKYVIDRAKKDAPGKLQRLDRCTGTDPDNHAERTAKPDRYYIENIKARDYRAGAYCLLRVNAAAGSISTETEH